jgi:hypothetical protein
MATAEEFLRQHPEVEEGDAESGPGRDVSGAQLAVSILGISENSVRFVHLGTEYRVGRDAVLRIEDRPDPADPAHPATLVVQRDAPLVASYAVSGADLASALPFAMTRPPIPARPNLGQVLFRAPGVSLLDPPAPGTGRYPSLAIYLTATSSLSGSPTETAGGSDDTGADDEYADYS